MVQGAEATDGHCDNSGSMSEASGVVPLPCGTCPVCALPLALEQGLATAGNGQRLPCCLAFAAPWTEEAAFDKGSNCPLVVALGGGEGKWFMTAWGCGHLKKEDWRVMGAEMQLGEEVGSWGFSAPAGTVDLMLDIHAVKKKPASADVLQMSVGLLQ